MENPGEAVAIVMVASVFSSLAGWSTWVIANNLRRAKAARYRAEVQNKMLDRFGNTQELLAYLQTEAGKQFLEGAETEPAPNPLSRILRALQSGAILLLLGLSLLFLIATQSDPDARQALLFIGTPVTSIGLGFLAAGALSYRLSSQWGLLGRHNGR
ncbi:MAG: hypothetical protein FJW20_03045 [Acidimicrobiia bacterium]|nr:hypothetical protein [Acidimicrobiia bacterium]